VAGGLRVAEPGADLAVAAALASAASGVPPPDGSAFIGEVALTGSVRPVPNLSARFSAAAAAGITTVFCAGEALATSGLTVRPVRHLREAIRWARRRDAGGRGRGRIAAVTSENGP
jgi:DNA repair protein RadA/Sms